jgi:hypothetical protein
MDAFRLAEHRYPTATELTDFSRPLAPGHRLSPEDFQDAAAIYGDHQTTDPSMKQQYAMLYASGKRFDGTKLPVFPTSKDHDVFLTCSSYLRNNGVDHHDKGGIQCHYSGFWLVLYTDGSMERIPYSHMMLVPWHDGGYLDAVPDQSGLPAGTIHITEWWHKVQGSLATWDP